MMYMTPLEAKSILQDRYNIETEPLIGDLMLAGEELRDRAPFVEGVDLDNPPDALLDWVALKSYQLSEEDDPAIQSEGVSGANVTYARPYKSQTERRLERLIAPYLSRRGYSGSSRKVLPW